MSNDEINELRTELEVLESEATPGPWSWFGNTEDTQAQIATVHGGRRYVMTFLRWGMRTAAPAFQVDGVMKRIEAFAKHEVTYRKDFHEVDHPDAQMLVEGRIALPKLIDIIRELQAEREEADFLIKQANFRCWCDVRHDNPACPVVRGRAWLDMKP